MGLKNRKDKIKEIYRNDIMNAAEQVFLKKGYKSTTIDDISEASEFSKKTIYSYFTSKKEIYLEIISKAFLKLREIIERILNENKENNGAEKINLLAEAYIEFYDLYPDYFKLLNEYNNEEENFEAITNEKCLAESKNYFDILKRLIEEGFKDGSIKKDFEPLNLTIILWSNINGLINLLSKKKEYIKLYNKKEISDIINDYFYFITKAIKK